MTMINMSAAYTLLGRGIADNYHTPNKVFKTTVAGNGLPQLD